MASPCWGQTASQFALRAGNTHGLVQEHCSGSDSKSSAWEETSVDFEPELSRAAIREVLK